MKTLRETLDRSGRKLGLTYTAPSSYWYLKWFDLPGLDKYVDWVNIMSYDLHGVWDSNNPIGAIVQGHTNLTEIKMAAELFWRVGIHPSKVALGFGFYGRAFTLADPSCTKPGCPFSGGAKPGVCTGTSGYLAHYEIQEIIETNKKRDIVPVHDREAAVKYMSWDNDQWISYDDADTFKQKIEWANSIGFAGSLIWASDLDDYSYTAHKAMTNRANLGTVSTPKTSLKLAKPLTQALDATLGKNCYIGTSTDNQKCKTGYAIAGYDTQGIACKSAAPSTCGWVICCPKSAAVTDCVWRGTKENCDGKCLSSEVKLHASSSGGAGHKRCVRGDKAMCCKASLVKRHEDFCRWTDGCDRCGIDETDVASVRDERETTLPGWECDGYRYYCCKRTQPVPFRNCLWTSDEHCQDKCGKNQVTIETSELGPSIKACAGERHWGFPTSSQRRPSADSLSIRAPPPRPPGGRKRSLCCTANEEALDSELSCDAADDSDYEEDYEDALVRRTFWLDGQEYERFEKRAVRPGDPRLFRVMHAGKTLEYLSRMYPANRRDLFDGTTALTRIATQGGFSMASTVCTTTAVTFHKLNSLAKKGFHTEHWYELQMPKFLLDTAVTGILPNGKIMRAAKIPIENLIAGWNQQYTVTLTKLVEDMSHIPGWTNPDTPASRVMAVLGGGKIMGDEAVMAASTLKNKIQEAINLAGTKEGNEAAAYIATKFQQAFGAFNYMNHDQLAASVGAVDAVLLREIGFANDNIGELQGLVEIFNEFMPAYREMAGNNARDWYSTAAAQIFLRLGDGTGLGIEALEKMVWTVSQLSRKANELDLLRR
ncbi:uncharacterized protein PgNI_07375 [Pyricularia grisea]|uniref:chitinase n=1 Tax=Pyricularia grisea TaxID=148305 RepID=A0A6P8B1L5_PYRGI|nr:uncharacterized protein PgNI_07375 [Pyricularia grisea]TLD08608.1 hypothetical protein PgNI_07375 [Pyricularia grisea]